MTRTEPLAVSQKDVVVEQRHKDAWERFGPAVFHCDMTGPEAFARFERDLQRQSPPVDEDASEPVAWLYEKNGRESIQLSRQQWLTRPDRGWTETPLYAAQSKDRDLQRTTEADGDTAYPDEIWYTPSDNSSELYVRKALVSQHTPEVNGLREAIELLEQGLQNPMTMFYTRPHSLAEATRTVLTALQAAPPSGEDVERVAQAIADSRQITSENRIDRVMDILRSDARAALAAMTSRSGAPNGVVDIQYNGGNGGHPFVRVSFARIPDAEAFHSWVCDNHHQESGR